MNMEQLRNMLIDHEALRLNMYKDSVGKWTIGVGHNLEDKPITSRAALTILEDDIQDAVADLDRAFPWWRTMLSDARQNVLADMCFNMGIGRLRGFTKMFAALQNRDWDTAADEMMDSRWAVQVGRRAEKLSNMMRVG